MPPLVEVRGASAGYRGIEVVRAANFAVAAGERVSIIGPNGCGKTTLLKAICKLIPLMGGDVRILGRSVSALQRRDLAASISMMAQISEQWFDFSVLDTVMMGRYGKRRGVLATSSSEDWRVAEDCLRTVGMLEQAGDSITWLSGGQRQRVMLARAFAQEPRIIVLDEPTNHLDLKHQAELFGYLQEWVSQGGRAVIQVMHDLSFARLYSDRILLMSGGALVAEGRPEEIMSGTALDDAYNFGIRAFMKRSFALWEENTSNERVQTAL
ncbi:MAG: ABC transporter ATP-binding protein [Gracilibacteraceae bacterium]|jgi:iron complex transport system ATP-binding protein|nr:ABC transporter ATP-binding protein [Gracilibacteraceae bacterium]